ncbi:MAG TPA: hypothetical protein VGR41_07890 [Actinomycetota bacterium]|nr:hypothetical protein [Actinomycetota bacterium]
MAGAVAMSVFVAAGAFAYQALRPTASRSNAGTIDSTSTVVAHLFVTEDESLGEYPDANLTFDGQTRKGYGTSWGWSTSDGAYIADTGTPAFTEEDYLQMPSGTALQITGDTSRVEGSLQQGDKYPYDVVRNLGTVDDDIPLELSPDRYILELTGYWPQGERAFYFPIEIVSTTAPVVTIDLTKDDTGASAVLSFEEVQQEGLPGDAILSEDGSPGFVWDGSLAVTDFVQVPSGAVLEYSGNAPEATATFLVWPPSSDGGAQVVVEGDLDLPADPGRYTLGVLGSWSDGEPFVFIFGIEIVENSATPSPGGDSLVPDVARVVCDENGIQVLTPLVAAQSDGLHLVFENPSGAKAYDLHPVTSERGTSVGGPLAPNGETTSSGFSLQPGEVQVACLPTMNDSYLEHPTASLTIEDPDGLWIPTDPVCTGAAVESSGGIGDVYGLPDDEVESAIREALVGLVEGDEVLKPG